MLHERSGQTGQSIADHLSRATTLDITNVREYFDSKGWNQFSWKGGDFPNVAPPWPIMFMEFWSPRQNRFIGVLFVCEDNPELFPVFIGDFEVENARWKVSAYPCVGYADNPKVNTFPFAWHFFVGPDGERIEADKSGDAILVESFEYDRSTEMDILVRASLSLQALVLNPCLLALSFCHCKNVDVNQRDHRPTRSERRRKEGPVEDKFYTLEIKPMSKILDHAVQDGDPNGLAKALHICRGHFKQYRGRGLFGKHNGLFWWNMHQRGSTALGKIEKEYNVRSPI